MQIGAPVKFKLPLQNHHQVYTTSTFRMIWHSVILLIPAIMAQSPPQFVDPHYKLVAKWEGWGTSLGWFSDVLGGLSEPVQEEINSALFSPENLNLNIVRYTIGATPPGTHNCGTFLPGSATESFRDAVDTPYIWSRDSRARKVLLAAKSLGADTFEAISFSPPSWLTKSGCSNGNPEGPLYDNFDPVNANTFADYLTEVIKYYHENYNINFTTISPFRMPSGNGGSGVQTYESCRMERSTMVQVIKSLHASIRAKGLSFCSITGADEFEKDTVIDTVKYLSSAGVDPLFTKVNTYWNEDSSGLYISEIQGNIIGRNHSFWMAHTGFVESSLQNMTQGLNLARRIVDDLRNLVPSAWVIWQAMDDQNPANSGLVSVPFSSATVENVKYNSGYYVMMQFSKYIKKGYSIIRISDWNSVAAYDATSQTLVLVSVNSEEYPVIKHFDLNSFSTLGNIDAFRTSKLEPHVVIPPPQISDDQFIWVEVLPQSVTTFRIHDAVVTRTVDNIIRNGDFESESPSPWYLMYGSRQDNGINNDYVLQGNWSGSFNYTESKLALMQNVTVYDSRTYFLSAWCSTNGFVEFGVLINGEPGPQVYIAYYSGYELHGLRVDAETNDVVTVYLRSEMGNHTAHIDNVVMH